MKTRSKITPELSFTYSKLQLNTTDDTKWYVGYLLHFENKTVYRGREHGKRNYNISLNSEKDLDKRVKLGKKLLLLVERDLERGINPSSRAESLESKIKKQQEIIDEAQKAKISIDAAIKMTKEEKGWLNPVPSKERTASSLTSFYNNQLKTYLESIDKSDDVRKVTRIDIKKLIDAKFNPAPGVKGWSASSCAIYKAWISILFGVLLEKDLIDINPVIGIKIKSDLEKIDKTQIDGKDKFEPWTATEVEYWFRDLKDGTEYERLIHASSHVLHYSFVRLTEILRLQCWMVDFENERLTIPPSATKSARKYTNKNLISVDMPDALVVALKSWVAYKYPNGFTDDDYLFPSNLHSTNKPFGYKMFTKLMLDTRNKFQKKYKSEKLYIDKQPYGLKHSGVIKLFKALSATQKTPNQIQQIVKEHCRHSSFSTTETYLRRLKLDFDVKREKVNF